MASSVGSVSSVRHIPIFVESTKVNVADLPADVRRRVARDMRDRAGRNEPDSSAPAVLPSQTNRTKARHETPGRFRCFACGESFTAWVRAQAHADETKHHRVEVVL
jgi:hypothetical protein